MGETERGHGVTLFFKEHQIRQKLFEIFFESKI